jgi:hypothetical protein
MLPAGSQLYLLIIIHEGNLKNNNNKNEEETKKKKKLNCLYLRRDAEFVNDETQAPLDVCRK